MIKIEIKQVYRKTTVQNKQIDTLQVLSYTLGASREGNKKK